ncbi:hypothetical protein GRJ2_000947600 [Grus japonensis]|uniref:Uncharacterized protein n=1 Tax=Grus japonensis TaxID=30415 RepID=A0ABC9WHV6_GRUJA
MSVTFAKTEEERLPTVLSTNDEIPPFRIPYLMDALTPACPAKPKILFMEVSREDEADLQQNRDLTIEYFSLGFPSSPREPYFKGNLLVQHMNMWKIHCYALMIFRWAIVAENDPKSSSFSIVAPNHFGIALLIADLE